MDITPLVRHPGSRPHRRPRRAVWAAAGRPRRQRHPASSPRAARRARTLAPLHDGVSLSFAVRNAGKKSVALDLTTDEGLSAAGRAAGPQRRADPVQRGPGGKASTPYEVGRARTRTWSSPRSPPTDSPGRGRDGSRRTRVLSRDRLHRLQGRHPDEGPALPAGLLRRRRRQRDLRLRDARRPLAARRR